MSDSNNIVDITGKKGGCQSTTSYMTTFINFLNKGNHLSLNLYGVPFTWCNDQADNNRIFERFDRAIANLYWLNENLDYNLHNY